MDLGEDKEVLLRAGRMNLPFGLRGIEHTLFIHSPAALPGSGVRDDINQGQETGLSLAYNGEKLRGEAMAIVANYQVSPDAFRERGYSAYLEWAANERLAVGASSLVTHAAQDVYLEKPLWRQAHGLFGRWSPWEPLAVLAEVDPPRRLRRAGSHRRSGQPRTRATRACCRPISRHGKGST